MLPARDSSHRKRHQQTKGERMGKTYHVHGHSKKARVSGLISDNVDFKSKLVRRDKERHFILLKGSINQQDITIKNIYAPKVAYPCTSNKFFSIPEIK